MRHILLRYRVTWCLVPRGASAGTTTPPYVAPPGRRSRFTPFCVSVPIIEKFPPVPPAEVANPATESSALMLAPLVTSKTGCAEVAGSVPTVSIAMPRPEDLDPAAPRCGDPPA